MDSNFKQSAMSDGMVMMKTQSHLLTRVSWLVFLALAGPTWFGIALGASTKSTVDFARDIRPILSDQCFTCHGPDADKRKAGLRLDTREGAFATLKSGVRAIVPGKVEESRLLQVVSLPESDEDHMPPVKTGKKLNAHQTDLLKQWIHEGAPWAEHWSYVVPQRPALPTISKSWGVNEIDRFVGSELEKHGLEPNPEADRATLLRRVSLDLLGLPPTPEEVDAFLADTQPNAYERAVERLFSSPHFGERLALAWLDQARYADTSGYHFDGFRQMHLWRDWVIQAFNRNQPFDQFTIEQLAGDLLPNATLDQKIATGFHRNVMTTDEGGVDPEEYMAKYCVDRVSTTAQVWLGTTMGCAECHDHKYDPVTTREFYQLYAFFHSVSEKGLDGTRVRNPAPVLSVPSPDQGSRLLGYLDSIPKAEKAVADAEAALPQRQASWETEFAARASHSAILSTPVEGELGWFLPAFKAASDNSKPPGSAPMVQASLGAANLWISQRSAPAVGDRTNTTAASVWIRLSEKTGSVLRVYDSTMAPSLWRASVRLKDGRLEVDQVGGVESSLDRMQGTLKEGLETNRWFHVAVEWAYSKKPEGMRVWIDGVARNLEVSKDASAPLSLEQARTEFETSTNTVTSGPEARGDLRLFARSLTEDERRALGESRVVGLVRISKDQRSAEQSGELQRRYRETYATERLQAQQRLETLRKEKQDLLSQIPDTMVMDELPQPRETFVLLRGNFQNKGERVYPNVPKCWPPLPSDQPTNRLALARWIASTNNPLCARVTVNRYWAMLFGTGLVKTSNDFGSQGERPSHPELLDWLACEFMQPSHVYPASLRIASPHSWDIKHVLRLMVCSATYRQSAAVSHTKLEKDAYNRLLSRGPRNRLEAELIRDNALAISGLLDPRIGGPSVKPYQPPGIWTVTDHNYEQSHGVDLYRRGLYVFWKRAAHYPSFQTFDAPSRETCTLLRPRTSTPLQSLVLMNDPVYVEAARALASRAFAEAGTVLEGQIRHAFRLTLGRGPVAEEIRTLVQTYHTQHERFSQDPKSAEALLAVGESPRPSGIPVVELAAMTTVANVLLNLNETVTH